MKKDNSHQANTLLIPRENDERPTLSVIMPTLNEEEGIEECITQIKNAIAVLDITGEIIISDCSTDHTPTIAQEMGAIVLRPEELGYGYAYRYAFGYARGEYIVIGDADTTYDFEELPKLYEPFEKTDVDFVIGNRLDGEIKEDAMSQLHRYIGNPLLTTLLNLFYNTGIGDAHSGFRIIRYEALDALELETDGMEFATEMIIEAASKGLTIEEIPITYHQRKGEATLNSVRDGWRHINFMIRNLPYYF